MNTVSTKYLDKLASLRFFAAFMVVIYHCGFFAAPYDNMLSNIYGAISAYGYVGVCVFFVLSGFVISHANDRWKGWKIYIAGRITRIYPPHWIVTFTIALPIVIDLFIENGSTRNTWLPLASNLALIQAWNSHRSYFLSLNLVTWSLSVEMFFYICFLLLRRLQDRYIYLISIVSYLVITLCTIHFHRRWTFDIYWMFYINPIARLPEFITGMAIYRLYKSRTLPKLWLPQFNFPLILVTMLIALYLVGAYSRMGTSFKESLDYVVIPLPFVVLIMLALLDERSNVFMHNKTLILLGESSFALYLIHKPISSYINQDFSTDIHNNGLISIALMLLVICLSVGGSIFFYKYIEIPVTRSLKALVTASIS